MITTKRILLVTSFSSIAETLSKFEAITVIDDENRKEQVWAYNKTPVLCTDKNIANSVEIPFEKIETEAFTKWCYKQGFEPGEYSTGEKFDTRVESCVLCSLAKHKGISEDTSIYNAEVSEVDMIIYESLHFIVVPELGSIKPGFVMIVPKKHEYLSVAQIPQIYMTEYMQVCEDIETILKGAFGNDKPVAFFEHGSSPSGFTSHKKSIVHAHTHVVVDFTLKEKYLKMVQMKPCPDLQVARDTHYFAYKVGAHGERLCCYDNEVYVQRQFPRQIMAKEMNLAPNLYNWRNTAFSENIHTSLFRIWEYLANETNLSYRIAERTECFAAPYGERFG